MAKDALQTDLLLGIQEALKSVAKVDQRVEDLFQKLSNPTDVDLRLEEALHQVDELEKKFQDLQKNVQNLKPPTSFLESFAKFEAVSQLAEGLESIGAAGEESRQTLLRLSSATGESVQSLGRVKQAAEDAFVSGLGESLNEALEKTAQVRLALGDVIPESSLARVTVLSEGLSQALGTEVSEVAQKSKGFITSFGQDGEEALNLLALGAQKARTSQDDLLDTIAEYSPHLASAKFSGEEFVGLLERAGSEGAFNLDKVGDAIKETQIRLKAGDTKKAIQDLAGQLPATLAQSVQTAVAQAEKGEISIRELLQRASGAAEEAFKGGQITDAIRAQLATALSGTPAEDLGTDLYQRLFSAPIDEASVRERAKSAGALLANNLSPKGGFFGGLQREVEALASSVSSTVAPLTSGLGAGLSVLTQYGPGLAAVEQQFGIFGKAGSLITGKLVPAIFTSTAATVGQGVATEGAAVAQTGLNTAMSAMPALLIIGALAAITVGVIALASSTKDLGEATDDVNASLDQLAETTKVRDAVSQETAGVRGLAAEYDRLKASTDPKDRERFAQVTDELASRLPEATRELDTQGAVLEKTAPKFEVLTNVVREYADEQDRLAEQNRADSLLILDDQARALADSYHESTEAAEDLRTTQQELLKLTREEREAQADQRVLTLFTTEQDHYESVNEELADLAAKRKAAQETLEKTLVVYAKEGRSIEEASRLTGLTREEVQKLSRGLYDANARATQFTDEVKKWPKDLQKVVEQTEAWVRSFTSGSKVGAAIGAFFVGSQSAALKKLQDTTEAQASALKTTAEATAKVAPEPVVLTFKGDAESAEEEVRRIRAALEVGGSETITDRLRQEFEEKNRQTAKQLEDARKAIDDKVREARKGLEKGQGFTVEAEERFRLALAERESAILATTRAEFVNKFTAALFTGDDQVERVIQEDLQRRVSAITSGSAEAVFARAQLTKEALLRQQGQELDTFVQSLPAFQKKAEEVFSAALVEGTPEALSTARKILTDFAGELSETDPLVLRFLENQRIQREKAERETHVALQKIALEGLRDRADRERREAIVAVEEALNVALDLAGGDDERRTRALQEATAKRYDIEQTYLEKTEEAHRASLALRSGFEKAFTADLQEEERRRLQTELQKARESRSALFDSNTLKTLSYEEYSQRVAELNQNVVDAEEALAAQSVSIFERLADATVEAGRAFQEDRLRSVQEAQDELLLLSKNGLTGTAEFAEAQMELLTQTGIQATGALVEALGVLAKDTEEGLKAIEKAFLSTLVDWVDRELTILTPAIYAHAAASYGPVLGFLEATGEILAIKALLALARNAISGLKKGTAEVPGDPSLGDHYIYALQAGEAVIPEPMATRERALIRALVSGEGSERFVRDSLRDLLHEEATGLGYTDGSSAALRAEVARLRTTVEALQTTTREGLETVATVAGTSLRKSVRVEHAGQFRMKGGDMVLLMEETETRNRSL